MTQSKIFCINCIHMSRPEGCSDEQLSAQALCCRPIEWDFITGKVLKRTTFNAREERTAGTCGRDGKFFMRII